jgi:hypothetical protein
VSEIELAQARKLQTAQAGGAGASFGIGNGGTTPAALLAWACVGAPILWLRTGLISSRQLFFQPPG